MTDRQGAGIRAMFAPDPAIISDINMSYEFEYIARYSDSTPHTVVFVSDGGILKVPAHDFEFGNYEEWKDRDTLPTAEVLRAASALQFDR